MQTRYSYKKTNKTKITDKVKMKLLKLQEYDCNFLAIDVITKEGNRTNNSEVMIGINSTEDIDKIILKLNDIKLKMKHKIK